MENIKLEGKPTKIKKYILFLHWILSFKGTYYQNVKDTTTSFFIYCFLSIYIKFYFSRYHFLQILTSSKHLRKVSCCLGKRAIDMLQMFFGPLSIQPEKALFNLIPRISRSILKIDFSLGDLSIFQLIKTDLFEWLKSEKS